MTVDRGGVVAAVALLDREVIRHQRVAPGRIDEKSCPPAKRLAVLPRPGGDDAAFIGKLDRTDPAAFDDRGSLGGGILEQDMVEFRPANLEGGGEPLVKGGGEIEADRFVVPLRDELDAEFRHADPFALLAYPDLTGPRHV